MVLDTNRYKMSKNASIPQAKQKSYCSWKNITIPELKIWLGLIRVVLQLLFSDFHKSFRLKYQTSVGGNQSRNF